MIRVFASPDRRARCISFVDEERPPAAPLELVQAFPEDEREAAWALLHELGGEPKAA